MTQSGRAAENQSAQVADSRLGQAAENQSAQAAANRLGQVAASQETETEKPALTRILLGLTPVAKVVLARASGLYLIPTVMWLRPPALLISSTM